MVAISFFETSPPFVKAKFLYIVRLPYILKVFQKGLTLAKSVPAFINRQLKGTFSLRIMHDYVFFNALSNKHSNCQTSFQGS